MLLFETCAATMHAVRSMKWSLYSTSFGIMWLRKWSGAMSKSICCDNPLSDCASENVGRKSQPRMRRSAWGSEERCVGKDGVRTVIARGARHLEKKKKRRNRD